MKYNRHHVLRIALKVGAVVCLVPVVYTLLWPIKAPRRVTHPLEEWFALAYAPPTTTGPGRLIHGKLDERFVVSWPGSLRVGEVDHVFVRITASAYDDILRGLIGLGRIIKTEEFLGTAKLEVTLASSDSGLFVAPEHSETQTVVKDQRYREWSWSVLPQATGAHELHLLVRGRVGSEVEDYDPERMPYNVAFNPLFWFSTEFQHNGWPLLISVGTGILGWLLRGLRKPKQTP